MERGKHHSTGNISNMILGPIESREYTVEFRLYSDVIVALVMRKWNSLRHNLCTPVETTDMNGYIFNTDIVMLICVVLVEGLVVRLLVGLFLIRHVLYRFNIVQHQRLKQAEKMVNLCHLTTMYNYQ